MDVAVLALVLEPPFAGVENHSVLEMAVSRLAEGSRSRGAGGVGALDCEVFVLAGPRDVELEALTVESLISLESWRLHIEWDLLT